ncbi:MAG TPA: hypothetical protein VMN37_04110 [Gemmatimonadales bacterium]|nr:hypothetical protein [Gemmatimonadales bacterium]
MPALNRIAILLPWLAAPAAGQRAVDLPPDDQPLEAHLEPLWSVGGVDAPEWAAFGATLHLAFGPDGALHVLDERNTRLLVVEGGRLRAEAGRKGGGPGEFQAPRHLAVLPTGETVVYDALQRRLSHFSPGGRFLGDAPATGAEGTPRLIFSRPSGGVNGVAQVLLLDGHPSVRTPEGMRPARGTAIQFHRVDDRGRSAVLHRARVPHRPAAGLSAFYPALLAAGLPDGRVALVDTATYEVTVVAPGGGVDRLVRRPLPPRPVTGRDRRAERERLLAELAEGNAPAPSASLGRPPSPSELRARWEAQIEDMRFPERFPQVRALAADAEGRLWIERTGEDPHGPGPIDIVTGDGRYVGTLPPGQPPLPAAFGPDGLVAWVETDALDVPSVRVARVRLGPPR